MIDPNNDATPTNGNSDDPNGVRPAAGAPPSALDLEVMRLMTMTPADYVDTLDLPAAMAALQHHARRGNATSADEIGELMDDPSIAADISADAAALSVAAHAAAPTPYAEILQSACTLRPEIDDDQYLMARVAEDRDELSRLHLRFRLEDLLRQQFQNLEMDTADRADADAVTIIYVYGYAREQRVVHYRKRVTEITTRSAAGFSSMDLMIKSSKKKFQGHSETGESSRVKIFVSYSRNYESEICRQEMLQALNSNMPPIRLPIDNNWTDRQWPSPEFVVGRPNASAVAAARRFLFDPPVTPEGRSGLAIVGKRGSGKTSLFANTMSEVLVERETTVGVWDPAKVIFSSFADNGSDQMSGCDYIMFDERHSKQIADNDRNWWQQISENIPRSTSVLLMLSPDFLSRDGWRSLASHWQTAVIDQFDFEFRRRLIQNIGRIKVTQSAEHYISEYTMVRLAEELWGDGWQIQAAVAHCYEYRQSKGRWPTPHEIDQIAHVIAEPKLDRLRSLDAVITSVSRAFGLAKGSLRTYRPNLELARARDVAVYIVKRLTGRPLADIAMKLDCDRPTAVRSMRRIEHDFAADAATRDRISHIMDELA